MIWQKKYTHKLPKLCSATLNKTGQEAKKYKLSNRGILPIHTLPSAVFPVLMSNDQWRSTPAQQILEHSQRSCPM